MKRFLLRMALFCLMVLILMAPLDGSASVASDIAPLESSTSPVGSNKSSYRCGGCSCAGCEKAVYDYDSVWIVGPNTVRGRWIPDPEKEPEQYRHYINGEYDAVKDGSWEGPTGDGCVWQKYEVILHNNEDGSPQTEITPFGELPVGHVRLTMRYGQGCAAIFM